MQTLTLANLLKEIGEELKISVYTGKSLVEKIEIKTERLSRPGLFLSGYEEHFDARRIQLIGNTEYSYLMSLSQDAMCDKLMKLVKRGVPAIIFTRGNRPPECLKKINTETCVLMTPEYTPYFQRRLYDYLCYKLAPFITVHGTMVDVYDLGILITGESGTGKSECALDLVSQGGALIADDVVKLIEYPKGSIMGTNPKKEDVFQNLIEIRGIGIIDVFSTFGIGAVKDRKKLDLVIELLQVKKAYTMERLVLEREKIEFLGIKIDKVTLPVIPGKHISAIIKTLALDFRLKLYGYNASKRVEEYLKRQKND